MTTEKIKIPFSYFGGKSKVAPIIWKGLGEVSHYIEPFMGSLAVLLASPKISKIETVNDKNYLVSNFWRAVSNDSNEVAKFADYPVTENDLHARHQWILSKLTDDFRYKMETDPDYYNSKIAGWWVWGMGASIGDNWLNTKGLKSTPLLSSAGGGIHGLKYSIYDQFQILQKRLRRVRVCCGDWTRILTPSITFNNKGLTSKEITGIFLDPPYALNNRDKVYQEDSDIFTDVCSWAVDNGNNPKLRIALCGYEGDYNMPDSWKTYSWKANGGMANLGNDRGKQNSKKEVIWFSPHCLNIF